MKIGIDARFVGPQGTGLGKYTEKLILNLALIDKKNQYIIFLTKSNYNYLKLPKNFKKVLADIKWYSIQEQIKLPKIISKENLDLLHVPHFNSPIFYSGKFIVTIHDLIHHDFSQESTTTKNPIVFKFKRFAYKKVINHAVKKSEKILVPSNFVKSEILRRFKIPQDKIVVTYEAAEEEYLNVSKNKYQVSAILKNYKIKKPFIIYVGNAYPHKNLSNLLKAIQLLNAKYIPEIHLVIASARDVFTKRLQKEVEELGLKRLVTLTGYIEPKDLAKIFTQSHAYVFPSLSEGFGIPGLNAMAAQIPVASSNIPTLKEIYRKAALYFNPHDVEQIKGKVRQVIIAENTRRDLIEEGKSQVKKYSWLKMAKETLDVYKQAS